MTTRPEVGVSSIAIWRASVLLPHPDSPTMARVRPGASESETSSSARTLPAAAKSPLDTA